MLLLKLILALTALHTNGEALKSRIPPNPVPLQHKEPDPEKPLLLTPYINAGKLAEARALSKVTGLPPPAKGILSYSGFLTVNPASDSNLFFWFFPAARSPATAPLLIWLNGGPSTSSVIGVFLEHGPFGVDSRLRLFLRSRTSWTQNHSVLYVGAPVGTGYSFTRDEEGYARTVDDVGRDLQILLAQFFSLFPSFKGRDFYVAGELFGGKYVCALAHRIHEANRDLPPNDRINLRGIAIGNGYVDPVTTLNYGDFLYRVGLIDAAQRAFYRDQEAKAKKYIGLGWYGEAYDVMDRLILGGNPAYLPTTFQTTTGYVDTYYNFLLSRPPPSWAYYVEFAEMPAIKRAIHIGNLSVDPHYTQVAVYMKGDMLRSVVGLVEDLLEAPEGYKVLFYSGNLDITVPTPATETTLNRLVWKGAQGYVGSKREIWRVGGEEGTVAGYWKNYKNLYFVTILNAGDHVPTEQPERTFEMITRFTRAKSGF